PRSSRAPASVKLQAPTVALFPDVSTNLFPKGRVSTRRSRPAGRAAVLTITNRSGEPYARRLRVRGQAELSVQLSRAAADAWSGLRDDEHASKCARRVSGALGQL